MTTSTYRCIETLSQYSVVTTLMYTLTEFICKVSASTSQTTSTAVYRCLFNEKNGQCIKNAEKNASGTHTITNNRKITSTAYNTIILSQDVFHIISISQSLCFHEKLLYKAMHNYTVKMTQKRNNLITHNNVKVMKLKIECRCWCG